MTKKQRILELYAAGNKGDRHLTSKIAAEVGTSSSYVRVVARQRRQRGQSDIDLRYWSSPLAESTLAACRAYTAARNRLVAFGLDIESAKAAGRAAYAAERRRQIESKSPPE